MVHFCIVLDVLEYQYEGSCADGSGILCQVVLGLPLDWTSVQEVSCKVSIIQGQYVLGCLVGLWTADAGMGESQGSCLADLLGQRIDQSRPDWASSTY